MSTGAEDVAGALVEALLPGFGIGVAVHDEDLRVLIISPSLAELSGTDRGEQVGRRLTEALPGEVGEVAEASLRAVAASREPLLRLEPAVEAGRERGWLIHVYPLSHAGRDLIAVIALDVTESRRAHEHLQRTRERLDTAQRMARIGSWSWDLIGDRWQWSEELFRIVGLSPTGPPPDFAGLLQAIPGRSPRGDPRRDDPGAARRPPVRDPIPGPDARRPQADPARARRARTRGFGHGRAHPRLRAGRHRARPRREPAARGRGARAAGAVRRDARRADARGGGGRDRGAGAGLRRRGGDPPRGRPAHAPLAERPQHAGAGRRRARRRIADRPGAACRRPPDRARLGAGDPLPLRAARPRARRPQQRGGRHRPARRAARRAVGPLHLPWPRRRGRRRVHGGRRERARLRLRPAGVGGRGRRAVRGTGPARRARARRRGPRAPSHLRGAARRPAAGRARRSATMSPGCGPPPRATRTTSAACATGWHAPSRRSAR